MKAKKNKILTVKQQKVMVLRVKKTGIAQFRSESDSDPLPVFSVLLYHE